MHQSDVIPKDELPLKGKQRVQYKVQESPKGPKAIEVDLAPNKSRQQDASETGASA